jgi:hypothetical protein
VGASPTHSAFFRFPQAGLDHEEVEDLVELSNFEHERPLTFVSEGEQVPGVAFERIERMLHPLRSQVGVSKSWMMMWLLI